MSSKPLGSFFYKKLFFYKTLVTIFLNRGGSPTALALCKNGGIVRADYSVYPRQFHKKPLRWGVGVYILSHLKTVTLSIPKTLGKYPRVTSKLNWIY
tara:strand:+ start:149 stop:439 length:291 start_codon:yes stop_codon:yes gene_type:complete